MHFSKLLSIERVAICLPSPHTSAPGYLPLSLTKQEALALLAEMLATSTDLSKEEILRVLMEREAIQSTGIGEEVAIPHAALTGIKEQYASLLIVPEGVEFAAIDSKKVKILFAVIGTKYNAGEHLRTLARVSRLLRNRFFREQLIATRDAETALWLIARKEESEEKKHVNHAPE
ncbi:PTS sugar transporter subunit IIA [Pajaroellobacter abortibovis]|uniref:PTS EIIA type-2 domain-containing protein n=1 Tax=Pajaroellobacter abortibovis TaxID=1882918 RepID=A0A1L6MZ78_9BACT|nr:PTS sugar transporter subunit IIA [Pajaroellobacter abortibovis]APS00901.1 hypothetical protein BCY86_05080 [Pajaroellobacter abortibovis]